MLLPAGRHHLRCDLSVVLRKPSWLVMKIPPQSRVQLTKPLVSQEVKKKCHSKSSLPQLDNVVTKGL